MNQEMPYASCVPTLPQKSITLSAGKLSNYYIQSGLLPLQAQPVYTCNYNYISNHLSPFHRLNLTGVQHDSMTLSILEGTTKKSKTIIAITTPSPMIHCVKFYTIIGYGRIALQPPIELWLCQFYLCAHRSSRIEARSQVLQHGTVSPHIVLISEVS